MEDPDERPRASIATVVGGAAGFALVALALTRHGIRFDPDSAGYLATARLLASHPSKIWLLPRDSPVSLQGRYPPLYPALLASVSRTADAATTARWLGIGLAALFGGLAASLVRRTCTTTVTVVVLVVLALNRGLIMVLFGFLMSDGMHALLALVLVALLRPIIEPTEPRVFWPWALGAALVASAGFGTRLAGAGLVLALFVIVLALGRGTRRQRLLAGAAAVAVGILPTALWMAHQSAGGTVGSRRLQWFSARPGDLLPTDWITNAYSPRPVIDLLGSIGGPIIGLAIVAACCWLTITTWRRARAETAAPGSRTGAALLTVAWSHLLVLDLSRLLFDPNIAIGGRHTMIWWTCMILAGGIEAQHRLDESWTSTSVPLRQAAIAVPAVIVLAAAVPFARALAVPDQSWNNSLQDGPSAIAVAAGRFPAGTPIYTNSPDTVYLQTGRQVHLMSLVRNVEPPETDPELERRVRREVRAACARGAVLVIYELRDVPVPKALETLDAMGLHVEARDAEGTLRTCEGAGR